MKSLSGRLGQIHKPFAVLGHMTKHARCQFIRRTLELRRLVVQAALANGFGDSSTCNWPGHRQTERPLNASRPPATPGAACWKKGSLSLTSHDPLRGQPRRRPRGLRRCLQRLLGKRPQRVALTCKAPIEPVLPACLSAEHVGCLRHGSAPPSDRQVPQAAKNQSVPGTA